MLLFLASVIEQLDLALEQISKGDVHYARFGMMLTDNAVELILHQIAKDKASNLKMYAWQKETYKHQTALDNALGRNFDAKVKFAKIAGGLSDEIAQTITTMHGYRNEVYHVGLKHEKLLPALAPFYFDVACGYLSSYRPKGLGWGSNQKLPERSKKYFKGDPFFSVGFDDFSNGCKVLREACNHDPRQTIASLADEINDVIEQQDVGIGIIARGVYEGQETTRDVAVLDTQAWRLAFSKEGRAFAAERGWNGNMHQFIEFLRSNYPHKFRSDPIESWRAQARRLRAGKNPHAALSTYQSFMASTQDLREAIDESAAAAEREIDMLIDRARGK
ncbi:MAG: hypothetical protein JHD07_02275 [Bradyrhizobium sp.]|uniref:hypothetical protein n=1 Tax=Bradyrhizobium sp. TaxID=376 RepID=UPI001A19EF53|nr:MULTISPECIES: hypothetical protein [Bradyrhizobium]MBJ7402172.1 hypothetical protein [Bradyrhizobium sp.]MBR0926308.1 hypothetical protein [Bradyrhizobium diazoefficiens]